MRMDSSAIVSYTLLGVFRGGIAAYVIWGYSRARLLLRRWARVNGFEILHSTFGLGGPFDWTSSNSQIVYFVDVRLPDGQERTGWIRCGSFWAGVISDKTEVRWESDT